MSFVLESPGYTVLNVRVSLQWSNDGAKVMIVVKHLNRKDMENLNSVL